MQQNQLLLGTFLNFLMLLYKHKNANNNNVTVFNFLHGATIGSFLVHLIYKPTIFFVHLRPTLRPKSTQHAPKIERFPFVTTCGCFAEYKGVSDHFKISYTEFFHSSYPITLFVWHITHLSPHRPPSEAQINATCPQECQINLYICFDEYKRGSHAL